MDKTSVVKGLGFELVERIIRFSQHLNKIDEEFYLTNFNQNTDIKDVRIFLNSYKDCLNKLMKISVYTIKDIQNDRSDIKLNKSIKLLNDCISELNLLHGRLNHLPRPSTPVELYRFSRIIRTQFNKIEENPLSKKNISIYVSERTVDETYLKDPISDFKVDNLNKVIKNFNTTFKPKNKIESFENIFQDEIQENDRQTLHVKIPRIDANNPCRWPTLLHEFAHHIFELFDEGKAIDDEFFDMIDNGDNIREYIAGHNINLKSWLIECWSDLLASLVMGPSLWFSQFAAFLFNDIRSQNLTSDYPPILFRLKLIERIIFHRLSDSDFDLLKITIKECNNIIEELDDAKSHSFYDVNNSQLRELFFSFENYFFTRFFEKENIENIREIFEPLIKYSINIEKEVINQFVNKISQGFPISSKETDNLIEQASSVQEILLASWLYRNNNFKDNIIEQIINIDIKVEELHEELIKKFDRFDESILKSIQVSEWFDLLDPISNQIESKDEIKNHIERIKNFTSSASLNCEDSTGGLLTDKRILNLLENKQINILPILNLKQQLGSSSFDVRLGTSFQLYYPSQSGIIDFIDEDTLKNADMNSKLVDLDFMESITLAPKQFMLAHTMEYVKLSDNIAAEIEGRSSYARLGIEVHMTAGFIDPGFEGTITLEIYNGGANSIRLYPGIRIAQLRFFEVKVPVNSYGKNKSAKYKGLLKHHSTLQFQDQEIKLISKEKLKSNNEF